MILVLTTNPQTPHGVIRAVMDEARAGEEPIIVTGVLGISLKFDNRGEAAIVHHRRGEIRPDVIFHWLTPRYARGMLDALDRSGFRLVNPVEGWRAGFDKALQLGAFEREGVPHPWTFFTHGGWRAVQEEVDWGAGQHVLKPNRGGRGRMVNRVSNREEAAELFATSRRYRSGVLVQEFIDHPSKRRHHYRINVINGEAATGGLLYAPEDGWVTNEARGGTWERAQSIEELPQEAVEFAIRATAAVGMDYAGVDVIEGPDGQFYVLETNEFPGFGYDTATYLGRFLVETARHRRRGRELE